MKNEELYRTAEERLTALHAYCADRIHSHGGCRAGCSLFDLCGREEAGQPPADFDEVCFRWLEMEAE